jgi:hypothetical protein
VKSREQVAKAAYLKLPVADKLLVMPWRELGNSWEDSLLSSGVASGPRPSTPFRRTPAESDRQQESDRLDEILLARRLRNLGPDETTERRQSAEHEAAHGVVALSLGRNVGRLEINPNDATGGTCIYQRADDPMDNAVIALAGKVWLEQFRYRDFDLPWGATGCDRDLQTAYDMVGRDMTWLLGRAFSRCRAILKDNFDAVITLSDKLDRDGTFSPYPTMTPRVRPWKTLARGAARCPRPGLYSFLPAWGTSAQCDHLYETTDLED